MMKARRSIRWQIQIWQTCLLAVIVTSLGVLWYQKEKERLLNDVDLDLRSRMITMVRQLSHEVFRRTDNPAIKEEYRNLSSRGPRGRQGGAGRPGGRGPRGEGRLRRGGGPAGEGRPEGRRRGPRTAHAQHNKSQNDEVFQNPLYRVGIWKGETKELLVTKGESVPESLPEVAQTTDGVFLTHGHFRDIIGNSPRGESVLVGYDLRETEKELDQLAWTLALSGAGVLLTGFIVGWIATGRAVRPVTEINRVSQKIAAGELSERIHLENPTQEISSLTTALNHTFSELEQTFEHLKRFTADASHELRNPIAAMLMEVEVALASGIKDEETRESLEVCKRNLGDMTGLVQSLLALARLDAGTIDDQREVDDLASVVEVVSERYLDQADEQSVKIITDPEPAPCNMVLGQMIQVLDNLLGNAFKYGSEGGKIEVSSGTAGNEVFLKVRDYGNGIPPEHLPHLFERFYRADESRTHQKGSTGIGLAIVEALVKVNGGTVKVESEVGQGSVFTVKLPIATATK